MFFRTKGVLVLGLVSTLFFACMDNNPSGPGSPTDPGGNGTTTFRVTYNGNGNTGGSVPTAQTKTLGVALTLSGNTGYLEKTGYTFRKTRELDFRGRCTGRVCKPPSAASG